MCIWGMSATCLVQGGKHFLCLSLSLQSPMSSRFPIMGLSAAAVARREKKEIEKKKKEEKAALKKKKAAVKKEKMEQKKKKEDKKKEVHYYIFYISLWPPLSLLSSGAPEGKE